MLETLVTHTAQDCLSLTDALLRTQRELERIPYFTRKSEKKILQRQLGMSLDELSAQLLELRTLLLGMEEKFRQKRFDALDTMLQTMRYRHMVTLEVLPKLADYFRDLSASLERYITKKSQKVQWVENYGERRRLTEKVYNGLHDLYDSLSVE
jgi:hypothetical protein